MTIDPRSASAFEAQNGFPLEPHLVLLALMGSHSHGTYLPPEEPDTTVANDPLVALHRRFLGLDTGLRRHARVLSRDA